MTLRRSRLLAVASASVLVTALAACSAIETPGAAPEPGSASGGATPGESESPETPEIPPVKVISNVKKGARNVPVDTRLTVEADGGTLHKVAVTSAAGPVRGKLSGDQATWVADSLL